MLFRSEEGATGDTGFCASSTLRLWLLLALRSASKIILVQAGSGTAGGFSTSSRRNLVVVRGLVLDAHSIPSNCCRNCPTAHPISLLFSAQHSRRAAFPPKHKVDWWHACHRKGSSILKSAASPFTAPQQPLDIDDDHLRRCYQHEIGRAHV